MTPAATIQHPTLGELQVFDHGQDWQIIGENFERWFSQWQDKPASLQRAIDAVNATWEHKK